MRMLLAILSMAPSLAAAALKDKAESGQVPAAAPEMFSGAYLGQVFLSLLVVIALLFAVLWVLRRFNGVGRTMGGQMRVLASVGLGQRERAVLVSVGEKQLLLGVAPGSVTALHVFEEPVVTESVANPQSGQQVRFSEVWKQAMGNRGGEQ